VDGAEPTIRTSHLSGVLEEDYCIDLSIVNGWDLKTIAMVCVDFEAMCPNNSCVNACCANDEICDLPQGSSLSGNMARNMVLECNSTLQNITIKDNEMFFHGDNGYPLKSNEYCIHSKGKMIEDQVEASVCNVRSANNYQKLITRLMTIFLFISVLSLFVSLVLHMVVPELRASMFTWMKISHLLSMQVWYIVMFTVFVSRTQIVINHSLACKILGYLLQYFMMASFFWVNVMSLDIWRTFRHMRGYGSMVERSLSKRRRFMYYSLYAWGCPLVVSIITMTAQHLPGQYRQYIYTPGIGEESCFLKTDLGKFFYFFLPVSVLIALNIIFFLLASWSLAFGVWAPAANDRIKRRTTQRFMIVVELFFIMGLNWIGEIVTWAVSWGYGTRAWQAALFFDIVNALQGFIIFVIVVMKSRIIKSIKRFFLGLPVPTSVQNSIKRFTERRHHTHHHGGGQPSHDRRPDHDDRSQPVRKTISGPISSLTKSRDSQDLPKSPNNNINKPDTTNNTNNNK